MLESRLKCEALSLLVVVERINSQLKRQEALPLIKKLGNTGVGCMLGNIQPSNLKTWNRKYMNLTLNCCSVPIISFSIQVVRKAKSKKSLIFQKSQRLLLPSPSCLYVYYMSRTLKFQVNSSYSFILCLPMLCKILSYQLCLNFSFSGAPHNEDSLCLLQSKEENKFVLDLLGLHSIHYRIQSGRDGHVEVGK